MNLLWALSVMYTPQTTVSAKKNPFFVFFRALNDEISKIFISQELYIKLNWGSFKMTGRAILLLVFNTIYTSRTKENGLRWEFKERTSLE